MYLSISDSIAANCNNLNISPVTSKSTNAVNTSVTQNQPDIIQPTNRQQIKSLQKLQIASTSPCVRTHKDSSNDVPFTTICQTKSTSPCSRTYRDSSNNIPFTIDSSVQCETEPFFKKPITGTKRKLPTENCTIRKRNRTKMITSSVTSQPDKKETEKSILSQNLVCVPEDAIVSNERIEKSPPVIDDDEPDAELVEAILRYFKMPAFIEPITDPDFVVEAEKRLSEVEVCNEIVDSKVISIDSVSTDLSTDLMSTHLEPIAEFTSTDSMSIIVEPTLSIDSKSTDLVSTESSTYDEFDSPASPSPPFNDNALPYEPPLIIPTSPKKLNRSVVQDILANFDKRKRLTVSHRKFKVPSATEEQILTSTRCRIENYVMSEWTANDIESCYNDLSNVRPSILSKCIIEVVMNTKSETLSREYTPPAPALPKTHQKVVVLIKRISRQVNRFEDLVLYQLEKEMFVLAGEKVSLAEGMNLTHLFIGLTDCMDGESRWSCVLFVYKCLYYFTKMAIPIIHSVLKAYPTLLPQFQDGDNVTDLLMNTTNNLQSTIAIILINTNLSELNPLDNGLKKSDLRIFLKKYYHFPCMSPTIDDFVDSLVNRLANGCNVENISYSLILIAKRKDIVWADEMVQRKLIPLLNHFLSTISGGAENDERIVILVSAISSIIKSFPITKDISNYQQMFYKMLDLTARHTIQEAAVMALLRTSRFGMVDVYKRICDWEPTTAVSRQCYSMLSTFLYRQNLSYWKQF